MTIAISKSVNFGDTYGGLTTVGFTLYNDDGTVFAARTTSGVYEVVANTGIYAKQNLSISDLFKGTVVWDTGGGTPVYAVENIDYRTYTPVVAGGGSGGGGGMLVVNGQWEKQEKENLLAEIDRVVKLLLSLLERNNDDVIESIKDLKGLTTENINKIKSLIENIKIDPPTPYDMEPLEKKINEISEGVEAVLEYNEVKQSLGEVDSYVEQISG